MPQGPLDVTDLGGQDGQAQCLLVQWILCLARALLCCPKTDVRWPALSVY